ncbi:MAG: Spy/CpxP family protein refolding chaperone [Candidatus Omnitrophica bacterium]|nr:Spy/CpxP family protein refolding chaperone [Candidatus Omnitrophota bacterium]
MKRKIAVVGLMVVFVVGCVISSSYAEGDKQKGHQDKGIEDTFYHKAHTIIMNQEELVLTDEQIAEIKALKLQTKKKLIREKAEIEIMGLDIKAALWEDTIDVTAVNALVDKKYERKKEKTKTLIAAYAQLKNMLTEEQKLSLKKIWKKSYQKKQKHDMYKVTKK